MSDNEFFIPTDDTPSANKRFPAILQLGILLTVLVFLFGVAYLPGLWAGDSNTDITTDTLPLDELENDNLLPVVEALSNLSLRGKAIYVYDVQAKRALYSKNADMVLPLASITKLMTALIAHELVESDQTIIIPTAATLQQSASGLVAGERFTSQALTDYAVISSSNDAAYALAAAVGAVIDGTNPYDTFIASMNLRAEELGLPNLKFTNATGLDISTAEAGAYGTAREISFLMEHILKTYPSILEATTHTTERVYNNAGAYHDAENTNPIINSIPNLLGSKTGYTDLAGGNLTIAFDAGFNRPIIITVLGSTFNERFSDVTTLATAVQSAMSPR